MQWWEWVVAGIILTCTVVMGGIAIGISRWGR